MPEAAAAGTTVTLTGIDFSSDPAKNVVTFFTSYEYLNGVVGAVERATSTELAVRVPAAAFAAGPSTIIKVTTEGRDADRAVVLKSDLFPEVYAITPQPARAGEVVTIIGKNLNLDPKQIKLLFLPPDNEPIPPGYDPRVVPTSSTGTTLQARVPADAKSGEVWVILYSKPEGGTYVSQTLPITITP